MSDRQEIAYLSDIDGTQGNIPVFGADGSLVDSTHKPSDFVLESSVDQKVQEEVSSAASDLWSAINDVRAIRAYVSLPWSSGKQYSAGDFCVYSGAGYQCKSAHTSASSFDQSKWTQVLTSDGKSALDDFLGSAPSASLAKLTDLAPAYVSGASYDVGQIVIKDGKVQIKTLAGFSVSNVEASIRARIANVIASIPTDNSSLANGAGYVVGGVLDTPFSSSRSYDVGDTCTHGGKLYRCTGEVSQGYEFDEYYWEETTVKDVVDSWMSKLQADWDETDENSPSYIKNKPDIPEIDDTLTEEGAAADAKAVGDALEECVALDDLPYKIANITSDASSTSSKTVFMLQNRTVNLIDNITVNDNRYISLVPPQLDGQNLSRDFYVVLHVLSDGLDSIPVSMSASLVDFSGKQVTLRAPSDEYVTYRFTEIASAGNVFLTTGFSDPAYRGVSEIERALDYILDYAGVSIDLKPERYIYDPVNKLYHRIMAVTDPDTGEVNIGVDQEGVPQPEVEEASSSSSSPEGE